MIARIIFAQMWKFFSHYGNRALLLLFMVEALGMSDNLALGIYALYTGLFGLGSLAGGVIGDRFLGVRRALVLGALLIGAGHVVFAFSGGFFVALALIVVGTSLFTPNISALLAEVSSDRERHFTIFYVVMNIGSLLSTIACPILAKKFGWHTGFGVAAVGMLLGVITLLGIPLGKAKRPFWGLGLVAAMTLLSFVALHLQSVLLPLLPFVVVGLFVFLLRKQPAVILPLVAYVLFFAIEEQMGSSLLLFTERFVQTSLPTAVLMATNPLVVLLFGAFVAKIKGNSRLVLPFVLTAVAFGFLSLASFLGLPVSQLGMIGVFGLISFSELLIGPFVYAKVSEVSSKGAVMAFIPLGASLASLLGGGISKGVNSSLGVGFAALFGLLVLIACGMFLSVKRNRLRRSLL